LVLGDRIPSVDSMSYFETGRNFVNGEFHDMYSMSVLREEIGRG